MVDKRFQVFVSSTFKDLEEERQEVMHALLELDCIPSGMELFPAANDSQWNLIRKIIDDCDYYILILAGRYGSIGSEGISYTEMEYRYALSVEKPIIAFIHKDPGKILAEKTESSSDGVKKLAEFRTLVEGRLCKMWASPQELGSAVSRSLIQLIKSTPAIGWVRADELADHEATLELLQLRRRVDELQSQLERTRISAPKGSETLAQGDDLHSFRFAFKAKDPRTYHSANWSSSFSATWNDIFYVIAPMMIHEATEPLIRGTLDNFVMERNLERLEGHEDLADKELRAFSLSLEDFQTLKVQLRALGLIVKSEKNGSVKDVGTYWTLTPYGDEVMTRLRAIKRSHEMPVIEADVIEEAGE